MFDILQSSCLFFSVLPLNCCVTFTLKPFHCKPLQKYIRISEYFRRKKNVIIFQTSCMQSVLQLCCALQSLHHCHFLSILVLEPLHPGEQCPVIWTDGESPAFQKKFHTVNYVPKFLVLICLFWQAVCKMLYVQVLAVAAEEGAILIVYKLQLLLISNRSMLLSTSQLHQSWRQISIKELLQNAFCTVIFCQFCDHFS